MLAGIAPYPARKAGLSSRPSSVPAPRRLLAGQRRACAGAGGKRNPLQLLGKWTARTRPQSAGATATAALTPVSSAAGWLAPLLLSVSLSGSSLSGSCGGGI